jgi:ubiquinone/menaquinone biosynthesis C-methylase UbiE
MKSWWLDEIQHAGSEHLDTVYVARYQRKAGFDPSDDISALRALGLGTNSSVLDIGAGTGAFALAVAPYCRKVVAVDVSPAMLEHLRARIANEQAGNIVVQEGGFLSYETAEQFDFVFTRNALHQIPDFWKGIALTRMASILRPGGILRLRDLVFDFHAADADQHIDEWLAGAVSDPADGWTAAELAVHIRHEYSTYSWLLEALLEHAGFEIIDRTFRRSVYGAYTCQRRASIR